jgi:hypothetical protein
MQFRIGQRVKSKEFLKGVTLVLLKSVIFQLRHGLMLALCNPVLRWDGEWYLFTRCNCVYITVNKPPHFWFCRWNWPLEMSARIQAAWKVCELYQLWRITSPAPRSIEGSVCREVSRDDRRVMMSTQLLSLILERFGTMLPRP